MPNFRVANRDSAEKIGLGLGLGFEPGAWGGPAMKPSIAWNAPRTACAAVCLAGSFTFVQPSQAAEYGWGTYLLGISIPMMGFTPPPGFYLSDSIYAYQGSASGNRKFPLAMSAFPRKLKRISCSIFRQ